MAAKETKELPPFEYPQGYHCIAGVDEVGRGPLVGDVVTAAVILDPNNPIEGLNDSKKLSEKKRLALLPEIQEKALAWAVGRWFARRNRPVEHLASHHGGDATRG